MSRRDQLLGVGPRAVLEAGLVRVPPADRVTSSERAGACWQIAFPFGASLCRHPGLLAGRFVTLARLYPDSQPLQTKPGAFADQQPGSPNLDPALGDTIAAL